MTDASANAAAQDARNGSLIQRIEIDGVPVWWLPDDRRSMVSLQFRIGRADEVFARMGITHIVEHLAFFKLGRPAYNANGHVENIRTVFHAVGTPDDVREFVHGIVAALGDLPLDRLADEARILRTEATHRSGSLWDHLTWLRYGAIAQGSAGLPELGLNELDPAVVTRWSAEAFTSDNASLWIAGPITDGLRIDLPRGERRPVPMSDLVPGVTLPAWAPSRIGGIALGLVVPRTSHATMAGRILTKRLETHLRYELGRSYEVSIAYQPLDAAVGHASIFASCLDEDAERVRAAFLATVDELVASGPTDEELADDCAGYARHLADPDAGYAELDRACENELVGRRQMTADALLAEMRATTPDDVRDALETALAEAILMGPLDETPAGTAQAWAPYPMWSTDRVAGERLDRRDRRFPWSKRLEQLIVGPDGVTWTDEQNRALTVRYADAVGLVIELDGTRVLYGRDGFRVRIHATVWVHGVQAVAAIDSAMPPERVVRQVPT